MQKTRQINRVFYFFKKILHNLIENYKLIENKSDINNT